MRNFPLFKNASKAPTPINWQKTYVDSLALDMKSLIDYSNNFLSDYRQGPDFIMILDDNSNPVLYNNKKCYSIENLKYHQYRDTIDENAYYFLKAEDYNYGAPINYKLIKSGRHIINNNKQDPGLDTYKSWDNIAIQPLGYNSFYTMKYYNGTLYFTYSKNAALFYKAQQVSLLDYDTRFFYKRNMGYLLPTTDNEIQILSKIEEDERIIDRQSILWTDVEMNPVMGFTYLSSSNTSVGEEIIIDAKISFPVITNVGYAAYQLNLNNALEKEYDNCVSTNSKVYFL